MKRWITPLTSLRIFVLCLLALVIVACEVTTASEPETVAQSTFRPNPAANLQQTEEPAVEVDAQPEQTEEPAGADSSPDSTPEPADSRPPIGDGIISMVVILKNGTAESSTPTNLSVTLTSLDVDFNVVYEQTLSPQPDERYRFIEVPVAADGSVILGTTYQGIGFQLSVPAAEITGVNLERELVVYETTDDPSVIKIDQVWYLVDGVTSEGVAEVFNWYFFSNIGDRVYIGNGAQILQLQLPYGARAVQLQMRADPTVIGIDESGDSPVVIDNRPILPGSQQQLIVVYLVDYEGATTLVHDIGINADRVIAYTYEPRRLRFEGEGFTSTGTRDIRGLGTYDSYTRENVAATDTVRFTFGDTDQTPIQTTPPATNPRSNTAEEEDGFFQDNTDLILGIGILMIIFGGMYFIYDLQKERLRLAAGAAASRKGKTKLAPKETRKARESRNKLIAAIAQLDESFERGEISEANYHKQRDDLKAQLRDLME